MTPADQALARRAVACAGWRPGMRTTCGRIVYAIERGCPLGVRMDDRRVRPDCAAIPHDALPDLNDPATLGCLLALVREAWQDPTITTHCWRVSPAVVARSPERGPERWSAAGAPVERLLLDPDAARDWQAGPGWDDTRPADILSGARCPNFRGPSEPAALVAALEAACQE